MCGWWWRGRGDSNHGSRTRGLECTEFEAPADKVPVSEAAAPTPSQIAAATLGGRRYAERAALEHRLEPLTLLLQDGLEIGRRC